MCVSHACCATCKDGHSATKWVCLCLEIKDHGSSHLAAPIGTFNAFVAGPAASSTIFSAFSVLPTGANEPLGHYYTLVSQWYIWLALMSAQSLQVITETQVGVYV